MLKLPSMLDFFDINVFGLRSFGLWSFHLQGIVYFYLITANNRSLETIKYICTSSSAIRQLLLGCFE